jgi:hypothetical protein
MAAADGMTAHVLQLNDVRLRRGEREVLAGVSFGVPRGEIVALMGLQVPARLGAKIDRRVRARPIGNCAN